MLVDVIALKSFGDKLGILADLVRTTPNKVRRWVSRITQARDYQRNKVQIYVFLGLKVLNGDGLTIARCMMTKNHNL